ncbi:MAG: hypothetical protein IT442_05035 [Phycisphaeraceae bacterium]|nr:hypothetical protein [Phycisphaeraceae bacterium]
MFHPSTEDLWLEVERAVERTRDHQEFTKSILRRLTGVFFDRRTDADEYDPENHHYTYYANMAPILADAPPSVEVEAERVIGHGIVAQAMKDGINAWVIDQRFNRLIDQLPMDFLSARGVLMLRLNEEKRFNRGAVTPCLARISPRQFFLDSLATDLETDEFRGHWYWMDVEDLLAEPLLTEEARAVFSRQSSDVTEAEDKAAHYKPDPTDVNRSMVMLYSVWCRRTGTIRVLSKSDMAVEVFPEAPYYGPTRGPYTLFDAYPITDEVHPLPPMVAIDGQVRDLNLHAKAMGRSAARRRSIGLVEASNPDLGEKLAKAEDGEILPAVGITGQSVQIEVGGVTPAQYQITEYLRMRLDRISGLTATAQGAVGQAKTASEAQIATAALGQRTSYLQRRFKEAVEDALWGVGWMMFHTEGVVIPVKRMDPYSMEMQEGLFFGGSFPSDQGATWEDFVLRVRLHTMQKVADFRERVLAYYGIFLDAMQRVPMMPWVRWAIVLRDLAKAMELEDYVQDWPMPQALGSQGIPPMTPPSAVLGAEPVPQRSGGGAGGGRGGLPALPPGAPQGGPAFPGLPALAGDTTQISGLPQGGGAMRAPPTMTQPNGMGQPPPPGRRRQLQPTG